MGFGVIGLVLLSGLSLVYSHSFQPEVFGPAGFGHYPRSFGHGYFPSPKAYPPLPKKRFTIADELKYGPKFNPRQFPKPGGFVGFPGFFPDNEGFFAPPGNTQRPQEMSGGDSSNRLTVQASASVSGSSGGTETQSTTTPAPSGATTEDEDKVVAGAPDQACPSGQMRTGSGQCRNVA